MSKSMTWFELQASRTEKRKISDEKAKWQFTAEGEALKEARDKVCAAQRAATAKEIAVETAQAELRKANKELKSASLVADMLTEKFKDVEPKWNYELDCGDGCKGGWE